MSCQAGTRDRESARFPASSSRDFLYGDLGIARASVYRVATKSLLKNYSPLGGLFCCTGLGNLNSRTSIISFRALWRPVMRWTVFLLASLASATASFANVTYIMDLVIPGFPAALIQATGLIETDGKLGVLSPNDLVSFNFGAFGPHIGMTFTPEDAIVSLIGADLVASGRFIAFAYGANDGGIFSFQNKFEVPGTLFWCNGTALV